MSLFEGLRDSLWSLRNHDQMDVIRHETVAQHEESVKLRILPQQLQVSDAVCIARQNDLSRIPSLRNMMGNVDDHDTRQSSHTMKLAEIPCSADNDGAALHG